MQGWRASLLGPHAAKDRGGVTREVGQDDVGAGSPQAHERLHHHLLLVHHAQRPGGFDHRVLAGDLHEQPSKRTAGLLLGEWRAKHFGEGNL